MTFLRAPSEAAMLAALTDCLPGLVGEDGSLACYTHRWALDWNVPIVAIPAVQIGRAHVWTPVTNAHLVCRLLLEKKKKQPTITHIHTTAMLHQIEPTTPSCHVDRE